MRLIAAFVALLSGLSVVPVQAEGGSLQAAITSGVSACEKWVLEPKSWADDDKAFSARIGLADRLTAIGGLPPGILPQDMVASATNFWRIDAGNGNGVFIAASSTAPVCNVVGGGPSDYQPGAEALVAALVSGSEWKKADRSASADMISDTFRYASEPKAQLILSRAPKPGERTDRVQFLATLSYQLRK